MVTDEIRKARLMALVHGLGQIVFNYGRPFVLTFPGATVDGVRDWIAPILYYDDLYNFYIRITKDVRLRDVEVNCTVCEQKFRLGGHDAGPYDVQEFLVPATGPNGKPWIYTKGSFRGAERLQHILFCNGCAGLGLRMSYGHGQQPLRRKDLLPGFVDWIRNEDLFEEFEEKGDIEDLDHI